MRGDPQKVWLAPLGYLGVALSRTREHDNDALAVLTDILNLKDTQIIPNLKDNLASLGFHTFIWHRAEVSRLLRRLDRVTEAEEHEDLLRLVVPIGAMSRYLIYLIL